MLDVRSLFKTYVADGGAAVAAVDDVSFAVPKGMIFTLLGPSGCGKATTLRSIAGLETPDSGEILVDGNPVFSSARGIRVPANSRGLGMVFQSYAIWPHMTVFENIAFPLQVPRRKASFTRRQIAAEVERVLDIVALAGYEDRQATQLSGGQQQRLALARALIAEPSLLLLDEPLSNLDAKLREKMRFELKRLQRDLGITSVYVTHDQGEALALSHQIAVMSEGRVVQVGTPKEIYGQPRNNFVAEFIGTTNFIAGEVLGSTDEAGSYAVRTPSGDLIVTAPRALRRGEKILLSIRPEDVQVHAAPPAGCDLLPAVVETQIFLGFCQDLELRWGGQRLEARVHPSLDLPAGSNVFLRIDPKRCVLCL
jgi:iron(III) transport system ATP-binding protein